MIGLTVNLTNKENLTFYFDEKEKAAQVIKDFEAKTTKLLKIESGKETYYINKENVSYIAA